MNKKDKNEFITVSVFVVIFVILGFVMIHFGFKIYGKINNLRKYGIKTRGTIIRYERRRGTKTNDYSVIPIVKFHTNSGEEIIFEGHMDNGSILKNICDAGDEVEIVYNPQNPHDAIINTFAEIWFFPLLLWIIGFSFVIFPPFTIWKHYREKGDI